MVPPEGDEVPGVLTDRTERVVHNKYTYFCLGRARQFT